VVQMVYSHCFALAATRSSNFNGDDAGKGALIAEFSNQHSNHLAPGKVNSWFCAFLKEELEMAGMTKSE
jgi:hypothetical protein